MSARWLMVFVCIAVRPGFGMAEDLDMPRTREAIDYLSPTLMAQARPRWRVADTQAGAAWGGFLAWPSVAGSALVDSNPLQRHDAHGGATGVRLAPRLVLERESGVHATAFYGWAEARLYPAQPDADQLDGRVGVLHDWAITRDTIVRLQGDLSRRQDRLDSREAVTGRVGGEPFQRRDGTASASVQQTFNRLFASLSGNVVRSSFEGGSRVRTPAGTPGLSDQTGYDLAGRTGALLGPALFVFAEPAANWHVLDRVAGTSSGTRLIAGLGTLRSGLVGGEIFAGWQRQTFTRGPASVSRPVYGGRISWWPTPAWTVTLAFDRRLEQAAAGTVAEPLGTPLDAQDESLVVRFAPSLSWWAEANVQVAAVSYLATARQDRLYAIGTTLAYAWRHDLDLTADVHLTHVDSTLTLARYDRAMATVGARYRY